MCRRQDGQPDPVRKTRLRHHGRRMRLDRRHAQVQDLPDLPVDRPSPRQRVEDHRNEQRRRQQQLDQPADQAATPSSRPPAA